MEKTKYFLLLFVLILISSCDNEDEENFYDSEYYIELKVGGETYRASNEDLFLGGEYFEMTNFYNFAENEIEYSFANGGIDGGYVVFNNTLSEVEGVYSYLFNSYLSNDTFNVCSSGEENLNIPLNIIQNDNQVNGTIKGEFEGYAVVEDWDNPCNYVGCCYEKIAISGKFNLKITQP